jgi:hypothetical protein
LYEDAIVGSMNAEIVTVKQQTGLRMLGDDLEAVILGDADDLEHCLVNDLTNLRAIFRGLPFQKIDSNQRHGFSLKQMLREAAPLYGFKRVRIGLPS